MDKTKSIANLQGSVSEDLGYFEVLKLQDYKAEPNASGKKYFRIALNLGENDLSAVNTKKLLFFHSTSSDFYKDLNAIGSGFYCVFNQAFFRSFGNLAEYVVFQSDDTVVFRLNDKQESILTEIFERMIQELGSDYAYKYDMIRTIISELIHFGIKIRFSLKNFKNI